MFRFFNSDIFDFELTRLLGSTAAGGCDTCEFLTAIGKIKKHDAESWYSAWKEQAERAERIAEDAARNGLTVLARNGFLRASNYYRAASYLFPNSDPRVVPLSEKSVAAFVRATSFMDGAVLTVDIPYEKGVNMSAYLYLPPRGARLPGKIPLLLYFSGADSTKEELHFLFGYSGPQLGYAVLLVEGPGQGLLLKKTGVHLRPDFEVVADKVLGYLESLSQSRPELQLDLERIAVAGAVTGGYFALRASTDPRVKACVAIDPFFSMFELAMTRAPKAFVGLWQSGWVTNNMFNWIAAFQSWISFQARWELGLGVSSMGVDSPAAMLRRLEHFSLDTKKDGKVLDRVACPVLLTGSGGGAEMYSSAENGAIKIHKLLTNVPESNKELWTPAEAADGGLSASIGAWPLLAQRSFQFLDKHFGIDRKVKLENHVF
jgi:alpha-beta hydrolase superfamily lysophospholipase